MLTEVTDGGNNFSSPVAITLPLMFEQSVGGSADGDDYFSFTAENDSTIDVSLTGLTADVDLHLYNTAGLRIAQSRTDGTADEAFTFDVTAGQQYILGITPTTSANSTYTVSILLDGDDGSETPDTSSQPTVQEGGNNFAVPHDLQAPVNFSQSVGGTDDPDDYFQITASESGTLEVSLTGLTADVDLHLYNTAGIRIAESRLSGTADEQFSFEVTEGTNYVLGVTPNTSANSPYQVSMTLNGEVGYDGDATDEDSGDDDDDGGDDDGGGGNGDDPETSSQPQVREGGNSIAESQDLQAPVNFSQTVGGASDPEDYFQITASESGTLEISLTGLTADVDLILYDAAGITLASSTNSGSADEQFAFEVTEGTSYVLQVTPNTDENSSYLVNMTLNGEDGYDGDAPDNDGFGDDDSEDGGGAPSEPHDLLAPFNFSQTIGGSGDGHDYVQFTAPESGTLNITLTGLTSNVDLFFYSEAGQELALSILTGTADEQISIEVTAGTNYVLEVAANDLGEAPSPYQVSMTLNGQAGTDVDDPVVGGDGFPSPGTSSSGSGAHTDQSGAGQSAAYSSAAAQQSADAHVVDEALLH